VKKQITEKHFGKNRSLLKKQALFDTGFQKYEDHKKNYAFVDYAGLVESETSLSEPQWISAESGQTLDIFFVGEKEGQKVDLQTKYVRSVDLARFEGLLVYFFVPCYFFFSFFLCTGFFRVLANSPNLWPIISSVILTERKDFPV
jgi:hypothetical protein